MPLSFRQIRNIGFSLLLLIVVFISLFSYFTIKNTSTQLAYLIQVEEQKIQRWYQLSNEVMASQYALREFRFDLTQDFSPIIESANNCMFEIVYLTKLTKEKSEIVYVKKINEEFQVYKQALWNYKLELDEGKKYGSSVKEMQDLSLERADIILDLINEIIRDIQSIIYSRSQEMLVSSIQAMDILRAFLVLSVLITILTVLIMNKAMSKPIQHLLNATYRISQGDLSQRLTIPQHDEMGGLAASFNTMTDELENTKARLQLANEYLNRVINNILDIVLVTDERGHIHKVNNYSCQILGYSRQEIIECTIDSIYDSQSFNMKNDFPEGSCLFKEINNQETFCINKKGEKIPVLLSLKALKNSQEEITDWVFTAKDITERKESEQNLQEAYTLLKNAQNQLLQAEKLAAIGQLAAGIAHEINNPIGFVISNLDIFQDYMYKLMEIIVDCEMKLKIPLEDKAAHEKLNKKIGTFKEKINFDHIIKDIPDLFEEIHEGTTRIKKIVNNLKDFAHPLQEDDKEVNIRDELEQALSFVWHDIKFHCQVLKDYQFCPTIICKPGELTQVFVNILINAAQSIEKNGIIELKTYLHDEKLNIEISDNGKGMSEEQKDKIFDPFFTTKDVGEGTGLGLYISYGIIKKMKGKIDVFSEIDKGTIFKIQLPFFSK